MIWRIWSVIAIKKGHYANKCPEANPKDSLGIFKVRKVEELVSHKAVDELKSIHQIRVRFSDINAENNDPFIRYWIKVYGNGKPEDGTPNLREKMC